MDRRSAAKGVTDSAPGRADRHLANLRRSPMAVGLAVRSLAPVHSTETIRREILPATRPEPAGGDLAGG
jgi:hypothetical protein